MTDYSHYTIEGDEKLFRFCDEIVSIMVTTFAISRESAIAQLNFWWSSPSCDPEAEFDIRYHETPKFWALVIFYKGYPPMDPRDD